MTALILLFGCIAIVESVRHSARLKTFISKKVSLSHHIPKAMGLLIITAQLSELLKVVEHISIINIAAAVLLLAITLASQAGIEGELH